MKSWINKQQKTSQNTNICYICKAELEDKHAKDKKYRGAEHSTCNLKCSVPKKIYIVFHNRSNYDYHFIIKELTEKVFKNYFFRRKYWEIHNLFSSSRKRSYKNW